MYSVIASSSVGADTKGGEELSTLGLSPGMYFYYMISADQLIDTGKLIIMR